jgi:hypothetical protein
MNQQASVACFVKTFVLLVLVPLLALIDASSFVPSNSKAVLEAMISDSFSTIRGGSDSEQRDIEALCNWAVTQGVYLSEDIQLQEDPKTGEWEVVSKIHSNLAKDEKIIHHQRPRAHPNNEDLLIIQKRVGRLKIPESDVENDEDLKEKLRDEVKEKLRDEDFGVLVKIPPQLVMSSTMLDTSLRQQVKESLVKHGAKSESHCANACLVLVFLQEWSKGKTSLWYPYLQTLPKNLSTGLYWDETEREYARKIGLRSMLKELDSFYEAFQKTLEDLFSDHNYDPQLLQWAFSTVHARGWKASYTSSTGERVSNIVCLGDMFNHGFNGNVCVEQESADSPVLVVLVDVPDITDHGLYLDYGNAEEPHRFPVMFGFCDKSCPTLPALTTMQTFNTSPALYQAAKVFGFVDFSSMVFYTEDGAISDRVWNAMLYKTLIYKLHNTSSSQEEKESIRNSLDVLYKACRKKPHGPMVDSPDTLLALYQEHRKEMIEYLLSDVDYMLHGLGPLPEPMDGDLHPHWNMLREFHEHTQSTFQKVKNQLLEMSGGPKSDAVEQDTS